jgi:hypothetical protein
MKSVKVLRFLQVLAVGVPAPSHLAPAPDVGDGEHEAAVEQAEPQRREAGVHARLVGAVAVEQRRVVARRLDVGPAHDGHGHAGAVLGGGPQALGDVGAGVVAPEHGLLLEQAALPGVHVVVEHRGRGDHGGVAVAEHRGVELGVGPGAGGRDLLRLLDHVVRAVVPRADPDATQAVRPLEQHEVAGEGVDPAQLHVRPVGDEVGPVLAPGRRLRRLDELEVLGAVGVGDDEEAVAVVLDVVLDVLLPRGRRPGTSPVGSSASSTHCSEVTLLPIPSTR